MAGMTCDRANEILGSLLEGRAPRATPHELQELETLGALVAVDAVAAAWTKDLTEVSASRGVPLGRSATDDLARLKAALDQLDRKLASGLHRMLTSAAVLRAEELDRARIRRLLGVLADPSARALLSEALKAGGGTTSGRFVLLGDGRSVAATPEGREAATALAARLKRYAASPFSAFLEKRRRVEDRLATLASDRKKLEAKASGQKNPHTVALGLLKLGLPVKEALRTFDEARGAARFGPQQHQTHLAVACARARREGESMQEAAARLRKAQDLLLRRKLGNADVVRGAAKSLASFDDLEAAAARFTELVELLRGREKVQEIAVRAAARLVGAPGSPPEIVARLDAAIPPLRGTTRAGTLPMSAVVLAASTSSASEVLEALSRLQAIAGELERRDAYPGPLLPTVVAELVSYKGEPAEVADLVAETARRLMGVPALPKGWLLTPDGELAAGLAKRYAY